MNKLRLRGTSCLTVCALALLAIVAFVLPNAALANTGADAVILNIVQVDYKDASGGQDFQAHAAAEVTVNLVESPLTISGRPTSVAGSEGDLAGLPSPSGASGTVSHLIALTATANGDDAYDLIIATNAPNNVTNESVSWSTVQPDGTTVITGGSPGSVTLGASVITDVLSASQLQFPGGTLTGIGVGDVVVISNVDYLVSAVTIGNAAGHTYADGGAHNDLGGTETTETFGTLTLAINPSGGNTAPAFAAGDIGSLAAEQVLVKVDVYGETTAASGTVDTVVQTDANQNGTYALSDNGSTATVTTTFQGAALTITKEASNWTGSGAFGGTATGDPGDILEYKITIDNTAIGNATKVVVTDAVPAYTTLVTWAAATGYSGAVVPDGTGAATDIFGTISDVTNTVALTVGIDSETQPGGLTETGYGDAGGTAAGSNLTIYVGDTSANNDGGTVDSTTVYTIYYQVQID